MMQPLRFDPNVDRRDKLIVFGVMASMVLLLLVIGGISRDVAAWVLSLI
ncbi:hypothetical protein [Sinorhizobium meliloti]|nr:hypothetical protein [Sinorhizobium meliloti]MDW9491696.1 hypothetical protein [Sinorhizobium meliloti]MQV02962.1 hypothetical protein [Sinorhizobium meliloti]